MVIPQAHAHSHLAENASKEPQAYSYAANPYYMQQQVAAQEGWSSDTNNIGKRDSSYQDLYSGSYDAYALDNTNKKLKDD
jgi:hypothetical protein